MCCVVLCCVLCFLWLQFLQQDVLGFLTMVFLFSFFDLACCDSISPMGGGLGFLRLVFVFSSLMLGVGLRFFNVVG